jgi:hypothetical protein
MSGRGAGASVKVNSTEEASERVVTDPELANAIKFLAVSVVDRLLRSA